MSPAQKLETPGIDSVAVIGAGPCGLAAAKYLLAEKKFSTVRVFEQNATVGGVWAYNPLTNETGIENDAADWVSPVYDLLETNIPHTLMNYTDLKFPSDTSLFPRHEVVKGYLDTYAEPLRNVIALSTKVVSVTKLAKQGRSVWEVQTQDLGTDELSTFYFDAVLVANGHYNECFIPSIAGLDVFTRAHPGSVSHSKYYRNPDRFRNKKVIVVGNSASGIDISSQISTASKLPVIVSEKTRPDPGTGEPPASWATMVPEISEFIPEGRSVRFTNGEVETDVDAVVFCTGYTYSFPFLKGLPSPVVTDGARVHNLYQHVFYIDDPTLAFLGIPQRIVPFPFSEGQAAWASRVWAGRLELPPSKEMRAWESALREAKGDSGAFHSLPYPQDLNYINKMHQLSLDAERDEALENDGQGKRPPFWDDEKSWVRAQMPLIKAASRKLGDDRHKVRDLEALGFRY